MHHQHDEYKKKHDIEMKRMTLRIEELERLAIEREEEDRILEERRKEPKTEE